MYCTGGGKKVFSVLFPRAAHRARSWEARRQKIPPPSPYRTLRMYSGRGPPLPSRFSASNLAACLCESASKKRGKRKEVRGGGNPSATQVGVLGGCPVSPPLSSVARSLFSLHAYLRTRGGEGKRAPVPFLLLLPFSRHSSAFCPFPGPLLLLPLSGIQIAVQGSCAR